jgi:ABC-type sulfate transport system substrate-binding protein
MPPSFLSSDVDKGALVTVGWPSEAVNRQKSPPFSFFVRFLIISENSKFIKDSVDYIYIIYNP